VNSKYIAFLLLFFRIGVPKHNGINFKSNNLVKKISASILAELTGFLWNWPMKTGFEKLIF